VGADYAEVINVSRAPANPTGTSTATATASSTHQVAVGPGLYQVRVAARDELSGRVGSAHAWIEIPDLASRRLTLSSVIVGARRTPASTNASDGAPALTDIHVDRRFLRDADLRFFLFVYNAARGAGGSPPDVTIQVQLLQENRTIIRTPVKKMATDSADFDRLAYAADLSLADLIPGRYALRVTVVDRVSKTTATQQARFDVQ